MSETVVLQPGSMTLDGWRRVYRGAPAALDGDCREAVEAAARTVERIVAAGEPVYGINTGFGKLAQTRIEDAAGEPVLTERYTRIMR